MPSKSEYWIGKRPTDRKRSAEMSSATLLESESEREAIYRLYRRYVKQWNDIELDSDRSLAEHTHEIHGASANGGGPNQFIFRHKHSRENQWLLDIRFSRGFKKHYPGMSCALNPPRSSDDIGSIRLHWNGEGAQQFRQWLEAVQSQNGVKVE